MSSENCDMDVDTLCQGVKPEYISFIMKTYT